MAYRRTSRRRSSARRPASTRRRYTRTSSRRTSARSRSSGRNGQTLRIVLEQPPAPIGRFAAGAESPGIVGAIGVKPKKDETKAKF